MTSFSCNSRQFCFVLFCFSHGGHFGIRMVQRETFTWLANEWKDSASKKSFYCGYKINIHVWVSSRPLNVFSAVSRQRSLCDYFIFYASLVFCAPLCSSPLGILRPTSVSLLTWVRLTFLSFFCHLFDLFVLFVCLFVCLCIRTDPYLSVLNCLCTLSLFVLIRLLFYNYCKPILL